ncbi:hypothetical protein B5X24_HaOG210220 [Helicoverpa armigera]|uniref:Uncharacterized protein n=1 Tax=Helicoverpa armigera TaxID=29058 RepID=A0A2W1BCJ5_HELAM|nr:hypothetical protein B5X24_HaOG210220 [Helicoverpa armigera]
MDRCRCADYKAAVKNLKFFTVGTHRPDIIENYDRGEYGVKWMRHASDYDDLNFEIPRAYKRVRPEDLPEAKIPKRCLQIEKMWCPFLVTPKTKK